MRRSSRGASALALLLSLMCAGNAGAVSEMDDPDWAEEATVLPQFPRDGDLLPFEADPGSPHRYFIDGRSIAVGKDGIVRFALVVKTAGGATNVSYEGLLCSKAQYRIYATGRPDGSWMKTRGDWKAVNRYRAILNHDFFCPFGNPVRDVEEAREVLKLGGYPNVR